MLPIRSTILAEKPTGADHAHSRGNQALSDRHARRRVSTSFRFALSQYGYQTTERFLTAAL